MSEGSGADVGPGEDGVSPMVLISSGWNSPRRKEFLIYIAKIKSVKS